VVTRGWLVAWGACAAACGHAAVKPEIASTGSARAGDAIVLYRDGAIVRRQVQLDVPAGPSSVTVEVAADTPIGRTFVVDRDGLEIKATHETPAPHAASAESTDASASGDDDDDSGGVVGGTVDDDTVTPPNPVADDAPARMSEPSKPRAVTLDVVAPHAGHYAIQVAFPTTALPWDAAYTLTTTPAHDRGVLRGAIGIINRTGLVFHGARTSVVDVEQPAGAERLAETVAAKATGGTEPSQPPAQPRALGAIDLAAGETRLELLPDAAPQPLRAVLVYDPIGTKLDNPSADLVRGADFGVETAAPTSVNESFEIAYDTARTAGLPGGRVRLLERGASGVLAIIGDGAVFAATARAASTSTIDVGTATGVTGHRERRLLTVEDDPPRLVEELGITLENTRDHPVDVVIREHLYREIYWRLLYYSDPTTAEGPQQIAIRTRVPAHGKALVIYSVEYK
jgi:hypothetical protein